MKANELRIGNLILKSLKSGNGRKIIDKVGVQDIVRIQENTGSFNYEAIPLTEDWLVKFGFKKQIGFLKFIGGEWANSLEVAYNDKHQWYVYFRNFNTGKIDDFVLLRNDLQYVHQLQNLYFTLTGEELTITEP